MKETKIPYSLRHRLLQAWFSQDYIDGYKRYKALYTGSDSLYDIVKDAVHKALSEPVDSVHYSVRWRDRDNKLVRCQAWVSVEDHEALRRRAEAAGCKVSTLLRAVAEGEF